MENSIINIKLSNFTEFLDEAKIWYINNYIIKYDTYFKMGGKVHLFVSPQNISKFMQVVQYLKKVELPYKILGFTTNVLLLDKVEYSILISTKNLTGINISTNQIYVECGYSLPDFVRVAIISGSSGFEGLEGIPGSLGGAIFMNAGAYGFEVSDFLISVDCINKKGELTTLIKKECHFKKRFSIFQTDSFAILAAKFSLQKTNKGQIENNIEKFHIARHSYQEFVYPNLGSLFSHDKFYKEILKDSPLFRAAHFILKVVFKNPLSKFIMRKRPNNSIFNWLVKKYIKPFTYNPSKKSMNILINDGNSSLEEMIEYILLLRCYMHIDIKLENEIVLEPIHSIDPEYKLQYEMIKSKLDKVI